MKGLFYRLLLLVSRLAGAWVFSVVARGIAAGYFIFFPRRVRIGLDFYQALFPGKSGLYYLWCTWKQYQNFTSIYWDRHLVRTTQDITYTSQGHEHLDAALQGKRGGIILMSHLGNWEVAAHLLQQRWDGLRLLMYMGIRHKEDIERLQKKNLAESGIQIVAVDTEDGSPLDILEGVRFLKEGGLVLQTGDIIWQTGQRAVTARFLDRDIQLPMAPHMLALLSGAPLYIFFAFRIRAGHYHFSLSPPIFLKTETRSQRDLVIRGSAQQYADILEQALRSHPFEWYHFEPFLSAKPSAL